MTKLLARKQHAAGLARANGHVLSSVWRIYSEQRIRSKFCVNCWFHVHFWRDVVWGNAVKFDCEALKYKEWRAK
jgi:hypothetical protein